MDSEKLGKKYEDRNAKQINQDALIDLTVQLGFNNVLDAFHNVHNAEVPPRFFLYEKKSKSGITLTDNFYRLGEQYQYDNLAAETESRWRLVETAWELNLPWLIWCWPVLIVTGA